MPAQATGVTYRCTQPYLKSGPLRSVIFAETDHLTSSRPEGSSIIRLSKESQAGIAWWMEFVAGWNGMSFLRPIQSLSNCCNYIRCIRVVGVWCLVWG